MNSSNESTLIQTRRTADDLSNKEEKHLFLIKKSLFQTNQIKEILNSTNIVKDKKRAEILLKLNDEKFKI